MTDLTANEKDYMKQTLNSLENLKRFLSDQTLSARAALPTDLYAYLARVKTILGNLNLGVSFAGNLAGETVPAEQTAYAPFRCRPMGSVTLLS